MLKTDYCGELRKSDAGRHVTLAGWVHRRRDHGRLIFVDLRDSRGLVQVVFNPNDAPEAHAVATELRNEFVVQITGEVVARRPGTENAGLPTGEIEVKARAAEILNPAKTPPFYINEDAEIDELLRLKYRYLDLRRPRMQHQIWMRHKVVHLMRQFLIGRGFIEVETPILGNPTPEGARDYLVPSRLYKGNFYALPQSPQQYKQLLMVAGYERYFQIARCFRDEDVRADRQPEFTQLDVEMSFVDEEDVLGEMEALYIHLTESLRPDLKILQKPFPRLTYAEAMRRFGTDKPDMRFGMELFDVTDLVADSEFSVFRQAAASGGSVEGIAVPGGASFSRKDIDHLTELSQTFGAKGIISVALLGEGSLDRLATEDIRSPMSRFLPPELVRQMAARAGAKRGDLLILVAGEGADSAVKPALDGLRRHLGKRLELADPTVLAYACIKDFPLLEWNEEDQRWYAVHHPFTSPKPEDLHLMETDPARVRARAYDIVCNGWEIGGGSVRIHRRDVQQLMFQKLGIGPAEQKERFGHMLEAFEYGAPPHGGIAMGLERICCLFVDVDDIREVMAFPKTKTAADPMTGAPSPVKPEALAELGLALRPPKA